MIPAGSRICGSGWMRKRIEVRLGLGDRERLEAVIGSGNSPQKRLWRGPGSFFSPFTVVRFRRCPPSTGRARDGPSSDRKIGIHITSVPLVKLIVLVPAELQLL